jgi:hypothetical protein
MKGVLTEGVSSSIVGIADAVDPNIIQMAYPSLRSSYWSIRFQFALGWRSYFDKYYLHMERE